MLRLLTTALLLLLLTAPATAGVKLRAYATAQTGGSGVQPGDGWFESFDTGLVEVDPYTVVTADEIEANSIRADYPAYEALAKSWITTEAGSFHAFLDTSVLTSIGTVSANTTVYGEWHDQLFISSDTLPVGTPVQLELMLSVEHSVSTAGDPYWYLTVYSPWVQYQTSSSNVNPSSTATGIISTSVGSTVNLWQTLNAQMQSTLTTAGSMSGTLDIGHTVNLFITAPEGVTFTSASGATYMQSSVVPEPSTFMIWTLLGLAVAGGHWSRRRKSPAMFAR